MFDLKKTAIIVAVLVVIVGLLWWRARTEPLPVMVAPIVYGTVETTVDNTRAGTTKALHPPHPSILICPPVAIGPELRVISPSGCRHAVPDRAGLKDVRLEKNRHYRCRDRCDSGAAVVARAPRTPAGAGGADRLRHRGADRFQYPRGHHQGLPPLQTLH